MRKIALVFIPITIILFTVGCTGYYCSTESLSRQLAKIDSSRNHEIYDFRPLELGALSGKKHFYNAIHKVMVRNKRGQEITLDVTSHTAARIINKNGGSRIVFFDTMYIKDSLLYGNKSHFADVPIKPVHLNDVVKLELQE